MSDSQENDIPFEDIPPHAAGADSAAAAPGAGGAGGNEGAEGGESAVQGDKGPEAGTADAGGTGRAAQASEERTPPGPGSTGPTGVREDLGTLADEARKLWSALEARVVAPAVQSYPEVARHLGAAGREVAAAVRSAVRGSEQSWRDSGAGGDKAGQQEQITVERVDRIDPSEQKNRD
ncbi:DUF5304 family protein [Catenulispora acidiphila]|uniref:DUF5304 family protein n=1 Tax=Catenulispora acidiphila TaxID=304895 RepID=UPI0002EDFD17|nr:DUF5304 family protein [Catenulispora acidiphila]